MLETASDFYEIEYKGCLLKIGIIQLKKLKIHEKTVAHLVEKLAASISTDRVLKDPIVIDEESLTVLDGMHRVAAFKSLHLDKIPACLINYQTSEVSVYRWFRVVTFKGDLEAALSRRYNLTQVAPMEALRIVNEGLAAIAAVGDGKGYIVDEKVADAVESTWIVKEAEVLIERQGGVVEYETEEEALARVKERTADYLLAYQPVDKRQILQCAKEGRLCAHKTTRHVIPVRLLGINVPLDLLDSSTLIEEANKRLKTFFKGKMLIEHGRNKSINNRRYMELVIYFV